MWAWLLLLTACGPTPVDKDRGGPPDDTEPVDTGTPATTDTSPPVDTDETGTDSGTPPTVVDAPDPITEVFVYEPPKVDVLFVIDASTSMIDEIEVLTGSLSGLVATWDLLGIDYHAGATDIDDADTQGKLVEVGGCRWAEPTHPMPGALLEELVDGVQDLSSVESGRMATYKALQMTAPGGINEGFLREDAELVVLVLTDETDQSLDAVITEQGFIDYMNALKPDPELVDFHAIGATEDYLELTIAIGGIAWSVDNTPFGPLLDAMTDEMQRHNVFTIVGDPVEDSIFVVVIEPDGTFVELSGVDIAWDATARTVDLDDYVPADNAVIYVTYEPAAATTPTPSP